MNQLNELWGDFVSLIFPKICIHCRIPLVSQEDHLCTACRLHLPKTGFVHHAENPVFQRLAFEPKIQQAMAFLHFSKGGLAQSIIHEVKYRGNVALAELAGEWMGEAMRAAGWSADMIVPVPIHLSRRRVRGFNQSDHYALGISQVMKIPVRSDVVIRSKKTTTQTRKNKTERWENIDQVYQIVQEDVLRGRHVLLVDDVLTTGATIGMLADVLSSVVAGISIAALATGK